MKEQDILNAAATIIEYAIYGTLLLYVRRKIIEHDSMLVIIRHILSVKDYKCDNCKDFTCNDCNNGLNNK